MTEGVLLVFIDGIGCGHDGVENPFSGMHLDVLGPLGGRGAPTFPGAHLVPIDASLGYAGLPQSATGQGVLFTGEDLIGPIGGHWPAQPTRGLGQKIAEYSFLRRAREAGLRSGFLNAYDDARSAHLDRVVRGVEPAKRRFAPSASTWTALAGGGSLRTFADVDAGRAATFDLTGELLRAHGVAAPKRTLAEAARAIAAASSELDVALFELFLTDVAGHSQNVDFARFEIEKTDRFLSALFRAIDPRAQTVVVTSDHGNLENLATKSHTNAKIPLISYGKDALAYTSARDLRDIVPRMLPRCRAERNVGTVRSP
ncbi:metalloenzyme [soil metagenome]